MGLAVAGVVTAIGAMIVISPVAAAAEATWDMGTGYPTDQNYCYENTIPDIDRFYSARIYGSWDQPITFGVKDLPGGYSAENTLAPGSNETTINASVTFSIPMPPDGVYHPTVYATDGTTTKTVTYTLTVAPSCP